MTAKFDFVDKRVLVTGASRGIGRALCLELAKNGAQVFAMSRSKHALQRLADESAGMRYKITIIVGDVTSSQDVLHRLICPYFPLHALVNNAGIADNAPIGTITQKMIERTFSVNVTAPIIIGQLVAKNFVDRQIKGSIVNVSSQASLRPIENHTVYSASKSALDMVTRTMALELGSQGIRVNSVNPTVVWTELGQANWSNPEKSKPMLDQISLKRFAEVNEVVSAILFLLSDGSSMTTGSLFPVDGGFSTK